MLSASPKPGTSQEHPPGWCHELPALCGDGGNSPVMDWRVLVQTILLDIVGKALSQHRESTAVPWALSVWGLWILAERSEFVFPCIFDNSMCSWTGLCVGTAVLWLSGAQVPHKVWVPQFSPATEVWTYGLIPRFHTNNQPSSSKRKNRRFKEQS